QVLDDYLPDTPAKLTYIITSLPSHGTLEDPSAGPITAANTQLVGSGNLVIYEHQQGYLGMDSFSFKANDGGSSPTGGYSNEATISIKVSRPIYVDDDAAHDPGPGDPADSDPLEDGSAEHPFDAIQEAVDNAVSTETIIVLPGTYTGAGNRNIDLKGKPVTVRSEDGPGTCIIDCQESGRGFYFHSGEGADSVLEGLTVTNGKAADQGGGIYCKTGSSPTIANCTFSNSSAQWGGGMFNENSSPTLTDCDFVGNRVTASGGGIYNYASSPTLTDCSFISNEAKVINDQFSSSAGGIHNYASDPALLRCTFTGNTADYGGGILNEESSPKLTDCDFVENPADQSGGGMFNRNSRPTADNCRFTGNSAGWGGGVYNYENSPRLTDCTFTLNSAYNYGGGVFNDDGKAALTDCTFTGNSAGESGGGLQNYKGSPTITGCTFSENSAQWGGGVRNYESNPTLANCTFSGNSANNSGGGVQSQISNVTITNCTFSANSSYWGGGVYNGAADSVTTLTSCILWSNTGSNGAQIYSNWGGGAVVTHSDVEGGWAGATNIDTDPLFADPGNGDYHLKSQAGRWDPISQSWIIDGVTSPCIDAGDPASPVGLEPSPNGGRINMGTYGGTAEASKSP
ncbi:MAG: hypothetical protein ACYS21_13405, partial [Planctomycetota bacterium]